jgi:hypothetical protein
LIFIIDACVREGDRAIPYAKTHISKTFHSWCSIQPQAVKPDIRPGRNLYHKGAEGIQKTGKEALC